MSLPYRQFPEETFEVSFNEGQLVNHTGPICRICFEAQADDNLLITPCKCTGSVKFIHEECLKAWLLSKQTDLKTVTCELCLAKFSMNFKFELKIAPCANCGDSIAHWFFLPLLVSVFTILVLMICIIIARIDLIKDVRYAALLLLACLVSTLMIVYLFITSIREAVFIEEISEWHILSVEPPSKELGKADEDSTDLPMKQLAVQTEILQVPGKMKIGSKVIRSPLLQSQSLSPIRRDGRVVGYATSFKFPILHSEGRDADSDSFHVVFTENPEPQ
jgi:hypothetical protein